MIIVTIFGVGTLGCRSAMLWAKSKEPLTIKLVDRDIVAKENLERQPLYSREDVGMPKAVVAAERLSKKRANKHKFVPITEDITHNNASLLTGDIIIDGTDNMLARAVGASFAQTKNIPFVYGGAVATQGSVALFSPMTCSFADVFSKKIDTENCAVAGIDSKTADAVARKQFNIGSACLFDKKHSLEYWMTADGKVCRARLPKAQHNKIHIEASYKQVTKICGKNLWQAWIDPFVASHYLKGKDFKKTAKFTLFRSGRILVHARDEDSALRVAKSVK